MRQIEITFPKRGKSDATTLTEDPSTSTHSEDLEKNAVKVTKFDPADVELPAKLGQSSLMRWLQRTEPDPRRRTYLLTFHFRHRLLLLPQNFHINLCRQLNRFRSLCGSERRTSSGTECRERSLGQSHGGTSLSAGEFRQSRIRDSCFVPTQRAPVASPPPRQSFSLRRCT